MKRFITYLYAYKNGQKIKNTGHIRVDVRGHILSMQLSMKDTELDCEKGSFFIIVKKEVVNLILGAEIVMQNGEFKRQIICDCKVLGECEFSLEEIIGVCVCFENDCYMASCWKDGEEELILEVPMIAAGISDEQIKENIDFEESFKDIKLQTVSATKIEVDGIPSYTKINLNEIYSLPSRYWHFSNNSFLLHGFWNYGYLVLKETILENEKRIALGIPGVFEQLEMVMATYFGFSEFEALSSQMEEISEQKNQPPKAGTFGCWFTNL